MSIPVTGLEPTGSALAEVKSEVKPDEEPES